MSPITKLDTILKLLAETESLRPYATDTNILYAMYPNDVIGAIKPPDIGKALKQLEDDKFIEHTAWDTYGTTFKGELFHQEGGYQGRLDRQNSESIRVDTLEKRQKVYESNMVLLTWILAVSGFVAACYYGLEIWKYFHSCGN